MCRAKIILLFPDFLYIKYQYGIAIFSVVMLLLYAIISECQVLFCVFFRNNVEEVRNDFKRYDKGIM